MGRTLIGLTLLLSLSSFATNQKCTDVMPITIQNSDASLVAKVQHEFIKVSGKINDEKFNANIFTGKTLTIRFTDDSHLFVGFDSGAILYELKSRGEFSGVLVRLLRSPNDRLRPFYDGKLSPNNKFYVTTSTYGERPGHVYFTLIIMDAAAKDQHIYIESPFFFRMPFSLGESKLEKGFTADELESFSISNDGILNMKLKNGERIEYDFRVYNDLSAYIK